MVWGAETVSITVTGELEVVVTAEPKLGYKDHPVVFKVDWFPYTPGDTYIVSIDYGDGTSDVTDARPGDEFHHVYRDVGTYRVTVTVENESTGESGSGEVEVTIEEMLTIDLSASPTSGSAPLTVTFTCFASGGYKPYSWTLDFGDGYSASGTRSSEGSWTVEHTFESPGVYEVTLTVEDSGGEL